jgi:hypothetical protein
MCWRTIGALASEVIEDAMLKAMRTATEGSVVKRALPPPPRDERGVPSRSAVESARSTSKMDRASCGAACAGEEVPLKATRRFETEAGQDAHLDRMHPSRRGYRVFRQMAGSAGPTAYPQHTSMDRRRVHTRPQEAAHASALRRSMRV